MKIAAFIPARSGSKRILDKNIINLNGHPLMSYTINVAIKSKIFNKVYCLTDSEKYANIARHYGAEIPFLRPKEISSDKSPDIEWVNWTLKNLSSNGYDFDAFCILRPTSPFRQISTLHRAINLFDKNKKIHSLRAVQRSSEHPGKMWVLRNSQLLPLMPFSINETPWHSCQTAALPEIYVQNASLEICWTKTVYEMNSISGDIIMPFLTEKYEGFDINTQDDLILAKHFSIENKTLLPIIDKVSFKI